MPYRRLLASSVLLFLSTGVMAAAPSNLAYPGGNTILYCPGQAMTPVTPTVTGSVLTFTVAPGQSTGANIGPQGSGPGVTKKAGHAFGLPAGMTFDAATGTFAGTPTEAVATHKHTVIAMNMDGSTDPLTIYLGIDPSCVPAGTGLPYSTMCKNQTIDGSYVLDLTGLVSVTPALPPGLSISSGSLAGTPTAGSPSTNYVFTDGSGVSRIRNITVQESCQFMHLNKEGVIQYPMMCTGVPIDTIRKPGTSGGTIAQCVAAGLPPGLSMNPTTCEVAGIPAAGLNGTFWSVQGYVGTDYGVAYDTSIFQITPCGPPPSVTLHYAYQDSVCINQAMPSWTPVTTGTITSFTVAPPLPAGMSLNPTTGVITGTPSSPTAQASYQITATGPSGSAQFTLTTRVSTCPPAGPQPHPGSFFAFDSTIDTDICIGDSLYIPLAVYGGSFGVFTVAPPLPAGLTLYNSTNPPGWWTRIEGRAQGPASSGNYVISSYDSVANVTVRDTVPITIRNCQGSSSIDYPAGDTLCVGQPMPQTLTPVVNGGPATACTQNGLPAGLTLGPPPACTVSGTPANTVTPGTYYVIVSATVPGGASGAVVQDTFAIRVKSCGAGGCGSAPAWVVQAPAPSSPVLTGKAMFSVTFNHVAGSRIGHIVGSTGTIRYTANEGADGWPAQASGTIQDLWDVTCSQVQTGYPGGKCYAGGTLGTLLSSLNANGAGATWTAENCPTCGTGTIRGLTCPSTCNGCSNAEFCLAVGDGGLIRRKTSSAGPWVAPASTGGNTLRLNDVSCKLRSSQADAPANYTCYAVGNGGTLLKSTDGGDNWSVITNYASAVTFTPGTAFFNDVSFNDENTGWVSGDNGILMHTSNGGATAAGWTQLASGTGNKNLYGLDTRWGTSLWVTGAQAALSYSHLPQNFYQLSSPYTTHPWVPQQNPATYDLYSAYANDSCDAWVVGENGFIMRTTTCACAVPLGLEERADKPAADRAGTRFGLTSGGTLWFEAPAATSVDMRLLDARGREVGRWITTADRSGHRAAPQPVPGLRPGAYILRVTTGEGLRQSRTVIFTGN